MGRIKVNPILVAVIISLLLQTPARPEELKKFHSKEGAFTVKMPGTPKSQVKNTNTASGPLKVHLFITSIDNGNTAYLTSYVDYNPEMVKKSQPADILTGAKNGQVQGVRGTLISEKKIKLGAYPGLELKIGIQQGMFIRSRIYLAKNRLYQCLVVGSNEVVTSGQANEFFKSFTIEI